MNNTNESAAQDAFPPVFEPTTGKMTLLIILTIVVLLTIVGNIFVLLSFYVEPRLRQPFNYFIFNLAVTDFLVAITAMSFYILDTTLGYWPFGDIMCGVWIYFDYAMTFASVFTLVAISIDRFWSVTWVHHYRQKNSPRRTMIIILIIWICVFIIWTPPFIGDRMVASEPYKCIWEPSRNQEFIIIVDVIGHYLPCLLMVVCYIKVFMVMRRQAKVMASRNGVSSGTTTAPTSSFNATGNSHKPTKALEVSSMSTNVGEPSGSHVASTTVSNAMAKQHPMSSGPGNSITRTTHADKRERKIFVTLTYVLTSYLICWFPFYVTWDIYAWHPSLVPDWLYTFLFWMTYVNSTLNPLLYAFTNRDFRQSFKKIMMCKLCQIDP